MISREPGQARKGAAAAVISCAGVWLRGRLQLYLPLLLLPGRFQPCQPALIVHLVLPLCVLKLLTDARNVRPAWVH